MPPLIALLAADTPSPTPTPVPMDQVTPGVLGFAFTAVFVVACILLVVDMVRRMRNVRYRAEAQEAIAAELAGRDAAPGEDGGPLGGRAPEGGDAADGAGGPDGRRP